MPVASEESEVDIEVEEMKDSSEEDFDEKEEEEEAGEDELEESENEQGDDAQSTATGHTAPLRIKLKLGAQPEAKPASRRLARLKNEDIESEDSDSDESQFNYSAGPSSSRQLTARQAALASAVDPSHVALDTKAGSTKKTQFTASEVALRKEENARKRKNMIEKKLEDEKAETIHRLLKKQSRPKNKRNTAAPSEEDIDMDEDDGASQPFSGPVLPMYRWVSTSRRPLSSTDDNKMAVDSEPSTSISFSIPELLLPSPDQKVVIQLSAVAPPSRCAVEGCKGERKYRAVGKAWGVGACGLGHLKILEGRA
ncbi:PAPA-1-like conserved region-domain-containing protein [Mycena leptocephala]|nr:PAPA-1-like conserved region-domain-containing protein [Mycena leptocephala]